MLMVVWIALLYLWFDEYFLRSMRDASGERKNLFVVEKKIAVRSISVSSSALPPERAGEPETATTLL